MKSKKAFMGIAKLGALILLILALLIILLTNDLSFFAKNSIYQTTKKNCEFNEQTIIGDSTRECNPKNCDLKECSSEESSRWEALKTGFEDSECFDSEDKCETSFEQKLYTQIVDGEEIDNNFENQDVEEPAEYSLSTKEFEVGLNTIENQQGKSIEELTQELSEELELNYDVVRSLVKKETGKDISTISVSTTNGRPEEVRFECHIYNGENSEDLCSDARDDGFVFGDDSMECTIEEGDSFSRKDSQTNAQAFDEAREDNENLAICSSSFGAFQLMGFNADTLGFSGEDKYNEFLSKVSTTNGQVELFFRYLENKNLLGEFQKENPNWDTIAYIYNGEAYRENNYAQDLASIYDEIDSSSQVS